MTKDGPAGIPRLGAAWALLLAILTMPVRSVALTPPIPYSPAVEVTGGRVRGLILDHRAVFTGIPFARPPVGDLRWRPPQPVAPWTGERLNSAPAPSCLQPDLGWNQVDAVLGREDCLYLDVATPELRPDAKLPVIVWIHGGANWAGSRRGTVLSNMTKRGVVLVAIQYRLGVFGFLSHPALSAEQDGASGNYALMDQIAALKWVKANIARFGGDPDKVTIAGQSAGAQDVGLLQLSPLTNGLFARAIQESGTAGFGLPSRSLVENEAVGLQIADLAGAPKGEGALAALRAMPGERLLAAQSRLHGPSVMPNDSFLWLQATVDGRVLDEAPARALGEGRASRPVLLGSNAREIGFYDGVDLPAAVKRTYGEAGVKTLALYESGQDQALGDLPTQVATDVMFRCPADFTARMASAGGGPAWLYQFDLARTGAATHSSELPYVFDDLPAGAPGVSLQAYWTNFARTGDPNGPGLPAWPRFGAERSYLRFEAGGPVVGRRLRGEICDQLGRP